MFTKSGMPQMTALEIRGLFWSTHLGKVKGVSTTVKMRSDANNVYFEHNATTRTAFCDFVGYLQKEGQISEALARRITLT